MREIKFRVWYKKEWTFKRKQMMETMSFYELLDGGSADDIEDYEWMQYTGLKDKQGVEIYEGDIVKHSVHNVSGEITKQILFWEGSFIAKPSYEGNQTYMSLVNFAPIRTMEVIGNIYENEDLLK